MASSTPVTPDTLITLKVLFEGENRRFKIPLRELGANTLPNKLRGFLAIPNGKNVVFERYSDSAQRYVVLATDDTAVWKQLWRAAKAKLKLRLKITAVPAPEVREVTDEPEKLPSPVQDQSPKPQAEAPKREDVIRTIINAQKAIYERVNAERANAERAMAERANASETTLRYEPIPTRPKVEAEAPVPCPFVAEEAPAKVEPPKPAAPMLLRSSETVPALTSFTVHCNNCNDAVNNTHWHCGICEEGDYDLCPNCVEFGVHCEVDNHFLIKRSIEKGQVVNSTMETATRTPISVKAPEPADAKVEEAELELEMTRTCNCCVNSFEESNFVTCLVCEDYDLCIPCHKSLTHGHHPSHAFAPVAAISMDDKTEALCAPGRNVRHFATCDGCDKTIFGVRNKCLNCPDFDYCSTCVKSAVHIHPGHRFVPIYEPIALPSNRVAVHYSIRCDGPLCKNSMSFVRGDRYKCAVCDDIDFCANCEALPTNPHNRTHPLIKFQTPVRNVMVTTYGERENGETMVTMGDRIPTRSQSTETTPAAPSANAATQVQTVAEVKPEPVKAPRPMSIPVQEAPKEPKVESAKEQAVKPPTVPVVAHTSQLEAHFVRDSIADGVNVAPGVTVEQTWTLRNPGPREWPAGCCVRYIGGDYMLNVDAHRPSSLSDLDRAIQSNTIATPVAVGQEVAFTVKLKTPQRPGKAISYWRLKTPDGVPFGHKLWCDVEVQVSKVEPEEAPAKVPEPKVEEVPKEMRESQMVFPTLDKESPVQSTHETETERSIPPSATTDGHDADDDLESLEMEDDETDDCYLTDEEYEILDAESNEEAANGRK